MMNGTISLWAGWGLTVIVTLFLLADGLTDLLKPQSVAPEMSATGWPYWTAPIVGGLAFSNR